MMGMNGLEGLTLLFISVAVLVLLLLAVVAVKLLLRWRANEASPVLSADAMVVSRRVRGRRGGPGLDRCLYFVTFEEPSGERLELEVSAQDHDRLAEGDRGLLVHQGTRFKSFIPQGAVDGIR